MNLRTGERLHFGELRLKRFNQGESSSYWAYSDKATVILDGEHLTRYQPLLRQQADPAVLSIEVLEGNPDCFIAINDSRAHDWQRLDLIRSGENRRKRMLLGNLLEELKTALRAMPVASQEHPFLAEYRQSALEYISAMATMVQTIKPNKEFQV